MRFNFGCIFLLQLYRSYSFNCTQAIREHTAMLCRVADLLALVVTLLCTIASADHFLGGYFMIKPVPGGPDTTVRRHGELVFNAWR